MDRVVPVPSGAAGAVASDRAAGRPANAALWQAATRYGIAIVAVAVVALIRLIFDNILGSSAVYLFFTCAVLVSAAFGGVGPAVLAMLLSGVIAHGFFERPLAGGAGSTPLVFFFAVSTGLIVLADRMLTWRDRAIAAARLSRADAEELGLLINGASDYAILMLDPDGAVLRWNEGARRITGWSASDVLRRSCALFYTPDQVAAGQPESDLAAAREQGRLRQIGPRRRQDGSTFLADMTITALRSPTGRLRGFAKVIRDVTAEQESKQTIEAKESQLRAILATVPDAMIVIDAAGSIVSFGSAAERVFGYPGDEIVGHSVEILMVERDRVRIGGALPRRLAILARRGLGGRRRVVGQRADGTPVPLELSIGHAVGGGQHLFTGFVRDLTAEEATEAKLQALQSELLHISRLSAMGTLASTLAHELNQPMTAVASYVEGCRTLLRSARPGFEAKLDEAMAMAASEAVRAGTIVRRLREFVARGESTLAVESIQTIVADSVTLSSATLRAADVALRIELPPAPILVIADRVQIQQVLVNLVRNAVEAMQGRPDRRLTIAAYPGSPDFARIAVTDTGPGLPDDEIFRAFHSTKSGGLGVGLSICRTIVEAHGGTIRARSVAEGGTTIEFTLPRDRQQADEMSDAAA